MKGKNIWRWFIIGLKLALISLIPTIPMMIILGGLGLLGRWVIYGGVSILLYLADITVTGFLVYKWRNWVFK
jgi:hypothetical protein